MNWRKLWKVVRPFVHLATAGVGILVRKYTDNRAAHVLADTLGAVASGDADKVPARLAASLESIIDQRLAARQGAGLPLSAARDLRDRAGRCADARCQLEAAHRGPHQAGGVTWVQ